MARPSLKTELDDIWTIVDEVFQELLILKAAETRNYQLKLNITKSNEPNHPLNAKKEKLVISPKLKFAIPCKNIRRTMKRLIKSLNLPDDKRKAFDVALRRSLRHRLRVIMKDKPYMSGGDVTKLYRDVHPKVDDEDFLKDLYERLENGEFDNYVDSDAENDKEHAVDVNVETNKEIEENKLAYDATSEYEPSDSEGLTSNKKTMELQSKAEMLLQESFKIKGIISVGLDESDFEDPILIKSDTDEVDNDIEIVESREIPEKKSSALFVSADFKGPTPAKETTDVLANVSKVLNENNEDNQNKEFEDNEEVNDGNENVDAATTELELADNADGARSISLIEKTLRTKLKINLLPASSKQLTQPKDMTKYNFEE